MDIQERFEAKFTKGEGCWEWKGGKQAKGYGQFWGAGRMQLAHRTSYQLYVGDIPAGLCVCHRCDNPSCVRPDHLFLGTKADNAHDCMSKGRGKQPAGEKHWFAKLAEEQVKTIRARQKDGARGIDLAKEYGVTKSNISHIVHNRYWKNPR